VTDELDTLQARLDALKAAQRARNGELPMYEHGVAVKADEPRYRVTPLGCDLLRKAKMRAWYAEAEAAVGWDANGSPVEGVR
jgi:hypothetical protein